MTPTAESLSVPYSNPMSDVLYIGRFCRCPIIDVYIGHSLDCMLFVSLAEPLQGREYVTPQFYENIGLVILPNLHRNGEGGLEMGEE